MKTLLFFSIFLTPLIINSQNKKLDFEYFLYGVNHCHFESYDRSFKENQVDVFFENGIQENIIAEYLKDKIKKDSINYVEIKRIDRGPNYISDRDDNLSQYHLYSELIEKGLDENFTNYSKFKKHKNLNLDIIKANSFITGAFLRNGTKINDTIYKISINVSSKPKYCYSILKKTNSINVVYDITSQSKIKPNVLYNPTATVYFNPSKELKEYFSLVNEIPKIKERIKLGYSKIYQDDIIIQKNKKEKKTRFYTSLHLRYNFLFLKVV